jgi:hypothetical protein
MVSVEVYLGLNPLDSTDQFPAPNIVGASDLNTARPSGLPSGSKQTLGPLNMIY